MKISILNQSNNVGAQISEGIQVWAKDSVIYLNRPKGFGIVFMDLVIGMKWWKYSILSFNQNSYLKHEARTILVWCGRNSKVKFCLRKYETNVPGITKGGTLLKLNFLESVNDRNAIC